MPIKIIYKLEVNDSGFPPISVELLNASQIGNGLFRIENSPYFAVDVAYGDIVAASPSEVECQYDFVDLVGPSTYKALSIILFSENLDSALMDLFRGQQCVIEYGQFGKFRVLAVAVPDSADYVSVLSRLDEWEARGEISYAELSVPR